MNCKKCERYFSAYIDNGLDEKQQGQFRKHLESCSHCRDEYAKFKKIVLLTTEFPIMQPSLDFDKTLQAKLAEDKAAVRFKSHYRWNFAFAIVAVCLFIATAGVYVHNFLERQFDNKQILVNRKIMPIVPIKANNNITTHFVMPNVPTIQINLPVSNHKSIEKRDETRNYVLPKVIYSSENKQETDYVLEKVSFSDDNEKGYWR